MLCRYQSISIKTSKLHGYIDSCFNCFRDLHSLNYVTVSCPSVPFEFNYSVKSALVQLENQDSVKLILSSKGKF